ncbi:MAG: peptidoglycan DD-metalloendopeptidase family protein [Hyphomicrobiales bacterium]|nr:peptidoglycan DD-metalloendopeptidase family protein [Hyphomicrobiales bacterium]
MSLRPAVAVTLGTLACGSLIAGLLSWASPSWGQTASRPRAPTDINRPAAPELSSSLKQREEELEKVRAEQRKAADAEALLKREIEVLADDRRKFNQQIIESASRVTGVEDKIAQVQTRLAPLDDRDQALRVSLDRRRDTVADILAALQRMGRQAPPALLLRTEDTLHAVRSAMMLGAILPEMKLQAEALAADLTELASLRSQITVERDRLARELLVLGMERQRLSLMIDERQKRQTEAERALADEKQRAAQLGRQAEDLNQLIVKLEQSLTTAARAAKAALRTPEERRTDSRPDLAAFRDPGRLTPAVAFASAKGLLPLPVVGPRIKEFGAPDGLGGTEKGLSIAARAGGQITAPCDGWVVYAGTFRNYGQLLILNAGGGYHVLLAGMERISVDLGQFVVTGEPVAVMGGGAQSTAVIAGGSGQPVLYVEFRKDGVPVDPGPWWAINEGQKVRG